MIIEDAVKTTKRLLTKQRQKERRERRMAFIQNRNDTNGEKANIEPPPIAQARRKKKIVRETAMHVSNQVVESKTYGEKSDNSPIQKRSKSVFKTPKLQARCKEVETPLRTSVTLKQLSSLNENPKELLKTSLATIRQILFPEKQMLTSDRESGVEGGHPFINVCMPMVYMKGIKSSIGKL